MPGPNVKPRFMQRCVADVTGQGKELGAAFAICTAQSQKAGYTKSGSSKMTSKGAAKERVFKNEPDMADKNAEYERAVQAGRKQEDTSMRALIRSLEEAANLDERYGRRQSYSRDPYLTKAKVAGTDKKGLPYKKGDEIMVYKDGSTYAGANKDQEWRNFQAAKDDEAFMGGGW